MRIDLNIANEQAGQFRRQSSDLRDGRLSVQSFQRRLRQHWRSDEVSRINSALSNNMNRLTALAAELDTIATDIVSVAQEIRRQEELADANAALLREDTNVANLRRAFDNAERQHRTNNTSSTLTALNTAQRNLNHAIQMRNDAATRVRSLSG